jgi:hypothetical protein
MFKILITESTDKILQECYKVASKSSWNWFNTQK